MLGRYLRHLLTEALSMKNKKTKQVTIEALDAMIRHVDKGPSGFWVDDYSGCGNPLVFPEFEDGLKKGQLIQKKHFLCPWNTAVMYGEGHGNIGTDCYYSCSIDKARYLTANELKMVLTRFKIRMKNGDYDCLEHISPLLTKDEIRCTDNRIHMELRERKLREEQKQQERLKNAASLIAKYPNEESLLKHHYGEKECVLTEGGVILFDPVSRNKLVGAEKYSYDEYLDVQFASLGKKHRAYFADCFFNVGGSCFKGQIEKIKENYICFKRILFSGTYTDGTMFDGKEDHVWMDKTGFEEYNIGDCVLFGAEVYRYIKTGDGKLIDYGLRNPIDIKKIEDYKLPTDDELIAQEVDQLICETCFLREHCDYNNCLMNRKQKRSLKEEMLRVIKD